MLLRFFGTLSTFFLILFSSSYLAAAEEDDRSVRVQNSEVFGALDATARNVFGSNPGKWALSHRWVGGPHGSSDYGAVVVAEKEDGLYQLCRTGASIAGTGTSDLLVYANNSELRGFRASSYSLDIGSCLLVEAKHLALRYSGKNITSSDALYGTFTKIDKELLRPFKVEKVSKWSMTWEKGQGGRRGVILTKNVPGSYQFCLDTSEVGPPTSGKYSNIVAVDLIVDGKYITGLNYVAEYALTGCTFISGSNIEVQQLSRSDSVNYFKLTGTLYRVTNKVEHNN